MLTYAAESGLSGLPRFAYLQLMVAPSALTEIIGRVLLRPRVLPSMLRMVWRFRARGWWRRPPFLPVPPREYLEWRLHTAYGDDGPPPTPDEVARYIRWADRVHRGRGAGVRIR